MKGETTMLQPRKMRYDNAGPAVSENLKKRHFDAYYCSTREEGIAKVLELIPAAIRNSVLFMFLSIRSFHNLL